jgi:hypothetical protein
MDHEKALFDLDDEIDTLDDIQNQYPVLKKKVFKEDKED